MKLEDLVVVQDGEDSGDQDEDVAGLLQYYEQAQDEDSYTWEATRFCNMLCYFLGLKFPKLERERLKKAGTAAKSLSYGAEEFIDSTIKEMN